MRILDGDRKLLCQLQGDDNLECKIRQTINGKKDSTQESEKIENKAPTFICKGASCIMKFVKNNENMKRTDQKEITFYSGW
ncbi:uncharacterized protein NPIL_291231 [Nephila pilipes]|uniref:Uncharacterized protein n=1 Tax=Nephila pilipes TaxID=299642 RepID=A0A8X6T7X4_NEPPI|nr:uncharacterized protein NPIL_291231 [Nephila pilipes]